MISRNFGWGGDNDHARYDCDRKKPEYNYGEDYCCFGPHREKKCKTYYDGELSNDDMIYDKSNVEVESTCELEQNPSTTTEVITTAKTTEKITTISQNITDSTLLQSACILGLFVLIST